METNKAERLQQAVTTLNDLIALVRSCELPESAEFLAMAKLNLLMELNGVTDADFRSLCIALENEAGSEPRLRMPGRRARGRRIEAPRSRKGALRKAWAAPASS